MKVKEGFILRKIADYSVVVAVDEASKNFNGLINLNDTGAFLWKLLETETTKAQLTESLLNEYDVDEKTANEAVDGFLKKLSEVNLLAE
jgi:Coenzyme PQQ synthesis protein D (PqqD).